MLDTMVNWKHKLRDSKKYLFKCVHFILYGVEIKFTGNFYLCSCLYNISWLVSTVDMAIKYVNCTHDKFYKRIELQSSFFQFKKKRQTAPHERTN